ncbi:hypothetical protein LINGRAHAP2_LOCUS27157 [Linum grandiflorum]
MMIRTSLTRLSVPSKEKEKELDPEWSYCYRSGRDCPDTIWSLTDTFSQTSIMIDMIWDGRVS